MSHLSCKICNNEVTLQFKATVLGKYEVGYFRCQSCKLIQTETPYWLSEAYEKAITDLDVGYVTRNLSLAQVTSTFIRLTLHKQGRFIDYGGGYGLLVRLLRDRGFDFYRQDLHCENIFAQNFDVKDLEQSNRFDLLTAFEVFEHLNDPLAEIQRMFEYSDSILFSTVLQPHKIITKAEDWWYIAAETGQHITFYHTESLKHIAKLFKCNLYSDGAGLHLITKRKLRMNTVMIVSHFYSILNRVFSRHFNNKRSLLDPDSRLAKQNLMEKITACQNNEQYPARTK